MEALQIYIMIAIVALAIIALFLFGLRKGKKREKITPLTGLAFGFIIAGIVFIDNRWLGYSFFGVAVVLSVVDIIFKLRKK